MNLGGAYIQQLETGGLLTGTLDVQQTARFENNIDAFGGLNIGTPGFVSSGPVGIYSEGAGSNVLSITASSSGKTAAFNLASFTNLATSTTASIIKSGLSITSTGAWTGISAKNIGLYIPSVTGGTSNYGIYNSSGANDYFSGNVGIGTTTPWGILSVGAPVAGSQSPLFVVASSTPTATTTVFIINASNNVGIGTTTPYSRLEVWGPDAAARPRPSPSSTPHRPPYLRSSTAATRSSAAP